jgi:integrase
LRGKEEMDLDIEVNYTATNRIIYPVTEGIPSPQTQKKYAYHFKCFVDHFEGITEDSLLAKAEKEPKVLEAMIIQWIKHLSTNRHHRHSTIHHEVAAILHFFEWNDVRLNVKKINRSIPQDEGQRTEDRHYSQAEIQQILTKCDERNRVIILLMASTGMRIGGLPGLRICDLSTMTQRKDIYKVRVYAGTRESYYTFTTPECRKAIDDYLTYREVHGETIEKDSPLIREAFDSTARYAAAKPKPLQESGLETIMYRVLTRSEVRSAEVMRSHGLRKFAITQMKMARVDFNDREYLVGHRHSRGLDIHYDRTSEEDRLAEYVKAIPLLTIDPTQRLEEENQELKSFQSEEIARLKWREGQQSQEIAKLKERLELQEQFANDYLETTKTLRDYIEMNKTSLTKKEPA